MQDNSSFEPPERNRRSNRYSSQSASGGNKTVSGTGSTRKKSKKHFFRDYQIIVLILLAVVCVVFLISMTDTLAPLRSVKEDREGLERERAEAAARFQREVDSYNTGYSGYVQRYAGEYDLRPAFVAAVIKCESSYDKYAVSSVGARGLMQLMPKTGEWIAGKLKMSGYTEDSLFDAETNIRFGCWYLHYLSGLFDGDPIVVACAYHAGQGNVQSWLKKYSSDGKTLTVDEIPMDDTKTYVRRIINAYAIYRQYYYKD